MNPLTSLNPAVFRPSFISRVAKVPKRVFRKVAWALLESRQRGQLTPAVDSFHAHRFQQFPLVLKIWNDGSCRWDASGSRACQLLVEWKSHRGQTLHDQPRVSIPFPDHIAPGTEVEFSFPFQALHSMGNFRVELSIGRSFENRLKVPPAFVNVDINEVGSEFDYHAHFASFDLEKDYWTVVGPTTEAEYHRLAGVKRQHLIDLGLTPDSKLLDVGCGTGQLASSLVNYLSDRGEYWGAELALPGVEWCRKKYNKPNFHFFQNEMTTIPLSGKQFDFIVYFSVFTHTYPKENRQLLTESKRLLAPNGCIFADFFTSEVVEDHIGHRGAVESNHPRLLKLISEVGLKSEEVFNSPWQTYGKRRFLKLTHA